MGDTWELTHTTFPFTHNTSADPTKPDMNSSPGIPLYSSKDLNYWKFEKWLLKSSVLPDGCPDKHLFWVPAIHRIGGKFHLVFTADNLLKDEYHKGGKIGSYVAFVGISAKVTGSYEKITWLEGAGSDRSLFEDTDGKTYAIMPFGDMFIHEVDLKGMKLLGERPKIVESGNRNVGNISRPDYLEGIWMVKRNGKYILFTAAPYKI